ncbi:hypothetical protein ACW2R7_002011 [Listeria monocytogenes]|uniref:hypothetical protein n=1 Tax=Listeria monocytogenes TaxID=1639 RepID=UPI0007665C25|nr:hypothetical protein [Listeria monocytogenes]EAC9465933.1 hypothetical protein [Listeria monocytogenes]EAD0460564.1 hypothetical protein [Listeria monocytogenes]EAD6997240.1 hypothetical protein [Listeria monocytogenes]EAD9986475.1 hypothetical protein [Listeria monocytogenes]EAE5597798.1 hypothetical protein [Listeria monocytogenes]
MKKLFNKTIFEENARRLGLKLTPVSESVEGGIFFKENLNDEFKKLTFDNFFKKDLFEELYTIEQLNLKNEDFARAVLEDDKDKDEYKNSKINKVDLVSLLSAA